MRLFLSSENLGKYPEVFQKLMTGKRLAFIENAKDDWTEADRAHKAAEHSQQLHALGFVPQEIDLRDYFDKSAELAALLKKFDGLFVFGGNTFVLRRAFAYSGLDRTLKRMIKADSIAYGGSSAGSIIVTPSLKGADKGDLPGMTPKGYRPGIIWDGLKLVRFYIVPHHNSDWFGREATEMAKYFESKHLPYKAISDGQVIVIDGDSEKLLA